MPGWKPQQYRSCFKSSKGNNVEGGSDWTAEWHSPLLSQFNILRIQMWLPTYCYNLILLPHSFVPQTSSFFTAHVTTCRELWQAFLLTQPVYDNSADISGELRALPQWARRYRHTGNGVQDHSCSGSLYQSHCGYRCTNCAEVKLDMPQRTILPLSLCKITCNIKKLAGSCPLYRRDF